jgi:hypothetical protein
MPGMPRLPVDSDGQKDWTLGRGFYAYDGAIASEWILGAFLGAGGFLGSYLGARLQCRLPEHALRRLLGVIACLVAVRYAQTHIQQRRGSRRAHATGRYLPLSPITDAAVGSSRYAHRMPCSGMMSACTWRWQQGASVLETLAPSGEAGASLALCGRLRFVQLRRLVGYAGAPVFRAERVAAASQPDARAIARAGLCLASRCRLGQTLTL